MIKCWPMSLFRRETQTVPLHFHMFYLYIDANFILVCCQWSEKDNVWSLCLQSSVDKTVIMQHFCTIGQQSENYRMHLSGCPCNLPNGKDRRMGRLFLTEIETFVRLYPTHDIPANYSRSFSFFSFLLSPLALSGHRTHNKIIDNLVISANNAFENSYT